MNSIFTFDNFRSASYLKIASISYEYEFFCCGFTIRFRKAQPIKLVYVLVGFIEFPVSVLANKDKL